MTVYRALPTVAKRASVGPRAQVLLNMKKIVHTRTPSTSGLGSDMIVVDIVLKILTAMHGKPSTWFPRE